MSDDKLPPVTAADLLHMAHFVKRNFHAYVPPDEVANLACKSQKALINCLTDAARQISGRLHPDQECALDGNWFHDGKDWVRYHPALGDTQ